MKAIIDAFQAARPDEGIHGVHRLPRRGQPGRQEQAGGQFEFSFHGFNAHILSCLGQASIRNSRVIGGFIGGDDHPTKPRCAAQFLPGLGKSSGPMTNFK
jgi:hypothetical protein